jgi:hypothetical protein
MALNVDVMGGAGILGALVADMFGVTEERVEKDLGRALARLAATR